MKNPRMGIHRLFLKNQETGLKPIQEIAIVLFFGAWVLLFFCMALRVN